MVVPGYKKSFSPKTAFPVFYIDFITFWNTVCVFVYYSNKFSSVLLNAITGSTCEHVYVRIYSKRAILNLCPDDTGFPKSSFILSVAVAGTHSQSPVFPPEMTHVCLKQKLSKERERKKNFFYSGNPPICHHIEKAGRHEDSQDMTRGEPECQCARLTKQEEGIATTVGNSCNLILQLAVNSFHHTHTQKE